MSIYDVDGASVAHIFKKDGNSAKVAYDVNGSVVYTALPKNLRVCTYNVGGWYIGSGTNVPTSEDAAYYALQNGMIAEIDADILCLNEFWTIFSQSGRTAASLLAQYYDHIQTADGNTQYAGRAICSKYPITSYETHYFENETARYYDRATIDVDGVPVPVFVTHLHPSNIDTRIAEASEMFDYIRAQNYDRYVVCGDFNSPLHDPFSEQNAAIYNQFLGVGCTLANDGAFGILNTACNGTDWQAEAFAIDQIILSDAFTIDAVATNLEKTTDSIVAKIDHVPLYADVTLKR